MTKRKRLGQHYLVDISVVRRMVGIASIKTGERVMEIGAGKGVLTRELSRSSSKVDAYEVDPENYALTRRAVGGATAVKVHLGDAFRANCGFDVLISSLPYSESSTFVDWLSQRRYDRAVILLQDDFARKLLAKPGERNYRAISAISQISSAVTIVDKVSREAFVPRPRVNSVLVTIKPRRQLRKRELVLTKLLFSQKKRKLATAMRLLGFYFRSVSDELLEERVGELPPDRILDVVNCART